MLAALINYNLRRSAFAGFGFLESLGFFFDLISVAASSCNCLNNAADVVVLEDEFVAMTVF